MQHYIYILSAFLYSSLLLAQNQEIAGKWKTIDDETGKAKSIVEIYKKNDGKYYGKIIRLFLSPDEDQDPICDKCPDDRKDKKILGLEIIRDMKLSGDELKGGTVCDPETGKIYDCKIWVSGGKLMVRGYLLFFFRTQTWERIE